MFGNPRNNFLFVGGKKTILEWSSPTFATPQMMSPSLILLYFCSVCCTCLEEQRTYSHVRLRLFAPSSSFLLLRFRHQPALAEESNTNTWNLNIGSKFRQWASGWKLDIYGRASHLYSKRVLSCFYFTDHKTLVILLFRYETFLNCYPILFNLFLVGLDQYLISDFYRSNYSQIRRCILQTNHYSQSSQSVDKGDFLIRRFSLYTGNLRTTGKSLFAVYTICGQRRFSYVRLGYARLG